MAPWLELLEVVRNPYEARPGLERVSLNPVRKTQRRTRPSAVHDADKARLSRRLAVARDGAAPSG